MKPFDTFRGLMFTEHGDDSSGYGLNIVKNRMMILGKRESPDAGTVLHSSFWPEQIFDLIKWRALNKCDQMLVGGNSPSTNPCLYHALGLETYHGDGECYADDSPSIGDGTRKATIALSPTVAPISGYADAQKEGKSSKRYFCEISRGCKNRCYYCQYGWLKPYREADIVDIRAALSCASTKTVRIFAADRFQHTQYAAIKAACDEKKALDSGSDLSLRFAARHPELFQHTRKLRFGIDGLSERIRRAVGKAASNDLICDVMQKAVDAGIKCFDWYMIYGFPGENEEDAEDFDRLMIKLGAIMEGLTLAIHWNAFQPNAMTPLQWEAPAVAANLIARQKEITGKRYKVKLMHKPPYTNPATTTVRTMLARAAPSFLPIVKNLAFKPSLRKNMTDIRKACASVLYDPCASFEIGQLMPWDDAVEYDRDIMIKCARKFRQQMGTA